MRDRRLCCVAASLALLLVLAVPSLSSAQSCQTYTGLTYGTYVDRYGVAQDLKLELLVPQGAAEPVPVVVWIHGGGWKSGSRLPIPARVSNLCSMGYAVASVDYRLTGVALWPAQIQDVKGAVRWLRAHAGAYGLDPDRFASWGDSAGAHLASMLGLSGGVSTITAGSTTVDVEGSTGGNLGQSSRVQAVVHWYGATDVLQMHFYPSTVNHDAASSDESRLVGGPIQDRPEIVATTNPITYASADDPPLLAMHGTLDKLIVFNQSQLLVDALRDVGVSATLRPVLGAGHGGTLFDKPANLQIVYDFLAAELVAANPLSAARAPIEVDVAPTAPLPAKPIVSVSLSDLDAAEPGGISDVGEFIVWRTGSTTNPLTVDLIAAGTAAHGTDYSLPLTVTFAAGLDRVLVKATPLDDFVTEDPETITLVAAPSSAIHPGPYDRSTVTLRDDDLLGTPELSSLSLSPTTVTGSQTSAGTVVIDRNAPAGGTQVNLSSSDPAASVPASVTVAQGASSATFTVTTSSVASTRNVEISASRRGVTRTAALTLNAPALSTLTLTPATFAGGCKTSVGKVTLTAKAPAGGIVVPLTNTNPVAVVPSSVTVPAGSTSGTFTITAPAVSASQSGTVTASRGGVSRSQSLTVRPIGVASLTLSPNPVVGPGTVDGTVSLDCPAGPGDITVALSSSSTSVASVSVPSLTFSVGEITKSFTVTTADVNVQSFATIKAAAPAAFKSVKLTVDP